MTLTDGPGCCCSPADRDKHLLLVYLRVHLKMLCLLLKIRMAELLRTWQAFCTCALHRGVCYCVLLERTLCFNFINKVGLDVCKLQRQPTSGSVCICTRVTALYCKLCTHNRNVFSWITSVSAALSVSQSEL